MEDFNQLFDDTLLNIEQVDDKTIKLKEGERRMVAILFADIKGFTKLSEKLDHEEVQTLLDQLLKIFSHCVELHGGYVDKYTGDQIMALFGAKSASEVDTQRSINTALLMLKKLNDFNAILKNSKKYQSLNINLSVRIGINTGMVTTGAVGKGREGDYTVYGDAVNLASRMESNAPTNTIMVPEETMELVRDYFIFTDQGEVKVKGKSHPISVFTVASKKDLSMNISTPFIGRENEISILSNIYNNQIKKIKKNKHNKINFVGITAEAGVGKSRLINEYLKTNKNKYFSLCHASNISSKPYYIFIRLIKDIFKISQMDSLSNSKEKFEQGIIKLSKNNPYAQSLDLAKPFIGFLIGISYNDDRLKDRQELQNHLNISIKTLLKAACYRANTEHLPYILILDDLHWIDRMSLSMLEYIINTFNVENTRSKNNYSQLLILSTYRSEYSFPNQLKDESDFSEIKLSTLKKEDSIKLIQNKTNDLNLNNNTIKDLIEKSKGNPFFIEEWISLLREKYKHAEAIDESRGIKNVYEVPRSINSLILARIDSLENTLKLLLQKATIIGEDFFIQILSKLENKLGADDNIDKPVHTLENEDFIHHYINQLDHYKFKHMLTRDVAYSTILISNKVLLHKAVAEIIEEYFHDKLDTFYFDLAIHYDISKDYDKALKYLFLAGKKHKDLFDFTHSIQCFERIITIIENEEEYNSLLTKKSLSNKNIENYNYYIKTHLNIANIFIDIGKWDKAKDKYDILNSLSIEDNTIKYELLKGLGQYYNLKRDFKNSILNLDKALNIANSLDNKSYIGTIKGLLADCEFDQGNLDLALKGFKEELMIFTSIKDDIGISNASGNVGKVLLHIGDLEGSLTFFKSQYKLSKEYDSKKIILYSLGNISLIYNIRGEYNKSLKIYDEVMQIAEDIHDLRSQGLTYGNLGIIYKNIEDYDKAIKNNHNQLKIAEKIGDKLQIANAYSNFGIVNQKIGNYEKSIDYHNKNIKLQKEINDNIGLARSFTNLSNTYFDLGNIEKAKKNLDKGIIIFKELGDKRSSFIGNFELSKFLMFERNYKKAISTINIAITYFEKQNDTIFLIRSYNRLSRMYRLNNNIDKSITTINKSLKLSKELKNEKLINLGIIEYHICNINKKESISYLKEYLENKEDLSLNAYIYYNIYHYLKETNAKSKAITLYTSLYKKINRFEYKYYLNQLK